MGISMTRPDQGTEVARLRAGAVEYRLQEQGDTAVVVFHGGHMRAGLALGEDVFTALGYTVLVPSRPGYGRTPLRTGRSASGFADVIRELCDHLGIARVAAVVGISAGGRAAVAMAARHRDLVQRLILQSAVGFLPWPDWRTRIGANVAFNAVTERATWGAVRAVMRVAPAIGLRWMLGELSTEPSRVVVAELSDENRASLVALFSRMRSGHGFLNDLRGTPDVRSEITQPALVIASRRDGAVRFVHAESLVAGLEHAELVVSKSDSHFIWFANDYPEVASRIRDFLSSDSRQRAYPGQ